MVTLRPICHVGWRSASAGVTRASATSVIAPNSTDADAWASAFSILAAAADRALLAQLAQRHQLEVSVEWEEQATRESWTTDGWQRWQQTAP